MASPLLPPPLAAVVLRRLARVTAVVLVLGLAAGFRLAAEAPRIVDAAARPATHLAVEPPTTRPGPPTHVVVASGPLAPAAPIAVGGTRPPSRPQPRAAPALAAPVTSTAPQSNDWPAARPPRSGRYDYDGTAGGQPSSTTLTITDRSRTPSVVRQREQFGAPDGSHAADVAWSPDAKAIEASACEWAPSVAVLRLPLSAGEGWHTRATCQTASSDGAAATVERDEDVVVKGRAVTTLDGTPTRVWIVERHLLTTVRQGSAAATSEAQTTELFAPAAGLIVYETGKAAAPNADGSITTSTWTMALRTANPVG